MTNMKVMVKMLKRGDPVHCEATTTVERKCKKSKKGPVTSKGRYHNDPKFLDRQVWANSLDTDQTAPSGERSSLVRVFTGKQCRH